MEPRADDQVEIFTGGLVYLASPYSHQDPKVRHERFVQACRAAGAMMRSGQLVYSPIAHTHPIALHSSLPPGWDFWRRYDTVFLEACERLVVLMIPGWEESAGVQAEIEIARGLSKPVHYVHPGMVAAPHVETCDLDEDCSCPTTVARCPACKSDRVEIPVWFNPNTGAVGEWITPPEYCICNACAEEHGDEGEIDRVDLL